MILHIPHASSVVPTEYRDQFVLADDQLAAELLRMTDAYTDELFALEGTRAIVFPLSRLLVDVERFADDADEPMARVGMGMLYERTSDGRPLRRPLADSERQHLRSRYYEPHHRALTRAVEEELSANGRALIVDCHSFPGEPLPCDRDQRRPRPAFCVGTDAYHTPPALRDACVQAIAALGHAPAVDWPFAGAIVPAAFYRRDRRVWTVMVEVRRDLTMDERTGARSAGFEALREGLAGVLRALLAIGPACSGPASSSGGDPR